MDVLVDGVARQLYLAQAQVHRSRLGDVHYLAVGGHHEDEPIERLQQMRAQLFDGHVTWIGRYVLGTPSFPQACERKEIIRKENNLSGAKWYIHHALGSLRH